MNKFLIETYNDPTEYYNSLVFDREELHIVGSSQLSMHIKDRYAFMNHEESIWKFSDIHMAMYEEWNNPINQLKLKIIIRELIENNCTDKIKCESFLRELESIHEDFKSYIETDIKTLNEEAAEDKRKVFIRKIYNQVSKCELVEELFYKKRVTSKKDFIERLNEYNNKGNKDKEDYREVFQGINKIYFYNLTFIDGPRYALFNMLNKLGFQVIFRIPEHQKLDGTRGANELNKPWRNLYSFIQNDNWSKESDKTRRDKQMSRYAYFLNGMDVNKGKDRARITFKRYVDPSEFKRQLIKYPLLQSRYSLPKEIKENIRRRFRENGNWNHSNENHKYYHRYLREYVALSKDNYNQLFNGTVLNYKDKDLSIMNFNEGKFLLGLYESRWINEGKDIKIKFDEYFNCITSGWIEIKSGDRYISGNNGIDLLMDLKPYLQGADTIGEILDRLEKLTWLHQFHNTFNEISKETIEEDRVKEYLHNPLKTISYSSNERYSITVKQLIDMTKKLRRIIEELLPKDNLIELDSHKKALLTYWKDISYVKAITNKYNQLKKIDTEEGKRESKLFLISNLRYIKTYRGLINTDDIKEKMTPDEVKEYMRITFKGNLPEMAQNPIKTFDQIDGIMVNGTINIFITDLSEKSINKYIKRRKFLQRTITDEKCFSKDLIQNSYSVEDSENILSCINSSEENVLNFLKYYLAAVTSFTDSNLEISWIDGVNDNDQQSSVFKILSTLYVEESQEGGVLSFNWADDIKKMYEKKIGKSQWKSNKLSLKRINEIRDVETRVSIHEDIAPPGWLDLDLCPRKFFYSSIITHNPVYSTDFHQRIAFAGLGKLMKSQNDQKNEVRDYLYPLFPQWDKTLKDNLIDTSYLREIRKEYRFKNIYFPYYIRDLQLLRSRIYDNKKRKHRNGYRNMYIKTENSINDFIKEDVRYDSVNASKGEHCDMCPHNMICTKGEFAIERTIK